MEMQVADDVDVQMKVDASIDCDDKLMLTMMLVWATTIYYADMDGDTYGDQPLIRFRQYLLYRRRCKLTTAGFVSDMTDCDDSNRAFAYDSSTGGDTYPAMV